jgi:hypothetical protein
MFAEATAARCYLRHRPSFLLAGSPESCGLVRDTESRLGVAGRESGDASRSLAHGTAECNLRVGLSAADANALPQRAGVSESCITVERQLSTHAIRGPTIVVVADVIVGANIADQEEGNDPQQTTDADA